MPSLVMLTKLAAQFSEKNVKSGQAETVSLAGPGRVTQGQLMKQNYQIALAINQHRAQDIHPHWLVVGKDVTIQDESDFILKGMLLTKKEGSAGYKKTSFYHLPNPLLHRCFIDPV
ncbi:hypothetical protein PoB_001541000 [Plakobranchus ocellatus]|uniref:Uncharacterized protein n=1 Tax=Plakobranchus ocellatus TaxID=259542 RepID=A0AAV3Z143_9GAST|nr:hypothetical protein PoB_001541000 [Plakobranchus ocellatus]